SAGAGFVTAVLEEILPGTVDQHSLRDPGTVQTSITTTSVTTTAPDYCFSGYVDQAGTGFNGLTVGAPFTAHDISGPFPIADADETQSSAGAVTATWTSGSGGAVPAAVTMCLT